MTNTLYVEQKHYKKRHISALLLNNDLTQHSQDGHRAPGGGAACFKHGGVNAETIEERR